MTRQEKPLTDPLKDLRHLRFPVLATRVGMIAEAVVRAFWPLWSIIFITLAPLMMGWHDLASPALIWSFGLLAAFGLLVALIVGWQRFHWPSKADALARVDATLPGRPIAAMLDRQAVGAGDPASQAVWQAHRDRMEQRTRAAKMAEPDLRVSKSDPFGLRYMALLAFVMALMFGSVWRISSVNPLGETTQTLATGPAWEGWVEPPAYTGKPSIYLADVPQGDLRVPLGSTITLRLYGEVGALTVDETVSARQGEDVGTASDSQQSFSVSQNGILAIRGKGGAEWLVTVQPDAPPTVDLPAPIESDAMGELSQSFHASDDYGVVSGTATIALDLDAIDRRHGLAVAPDARAPLVLDLPMPFTGGRDDFEEILVENLSEHPFANLPVTMTFAVADAQGQDGMSQPRDLVLPGRRFFQPLAKAVIEQRRDLMWSKANAPRVAQMLRAISHRPNDIFSSETSYLRLRFIIRRLETHTDFGLTEPLQTEIAEALYDLAVQLEDGTLADARERLARAQERLAEAMRDGASKEEIDQLMQELRDAIDNYTQMLAQQMPQDDQTDQPDRSQDTFEFTQDELQALMDRIQELMEEGRMAEAQALMDQLNQLMENLQVTQGQNGNGPQTPGQRSMQDLADTLDDQKDLSDEAFRDLQEQFNQSQNQGQSQGQDQGQNQGQSQGQGQDPSQQPQGGRDGEGQGVGEAPQSGQQNDQGQGGEGDRGALADRQRALREELQRQRDNLPNLNGDNAEAARRALDRAEGAMDGAEEALRNNNLPEAIDRQAEAMDALRDGLRRLGEALADNRLQEPGQGTEQGSASGRVEPNRRDPLGRQLGTTGQYGTDQNMLNGDDVNRRAEQLLKELRQRSSEQERPALELDYLRRLLDRF